MDAIVTEDVRFHLKRNQQASPKKRGQKKSHCLLSVSETTSDPFHFRHLDLLFLFDIKGKKGGGEE